MKVSKQRIERLKKRLDQYYEAEEKILLGQSVTIGDNQITRASLSAVQDKIKELEEQIEALETYGSKKRRTMRAVPWE
jgi:hypothetical protein